MTKAKLLGEIKSKWITAYRKRTGVLPSKAERIAFACGVSGGWNIHRKRNAIEGIKSERERILKIVEKQKRLEFACSCGKTRWYNYLHLQELKQQISEGKAK